MTLVDAMERVVDSLSNSIVDHAHTLDATIGTRPFGTTKLSERQQVQRYSLIRGQEDAWKEMVKQHGPGPTISYAKRMEKMLARYPDEDRSENATLTSMTPPPEQPPEVPPSAA